MNVCLESMKILILFDKNQIRNQKDEENMDLKP